MRRLERFSEVMSAGIAGWGGGGVAVAVARDEAGAAREELPLARVREGVPDDMVLGGGAQRALM